MPIDLDYNDEGGDWIKGRSRFRYEAGDVGVPRSDAQTADELLAFLNAEETDTETQRRLVRVYLAEWDVPEQVVRELRGRGLL